MTKHYTFSEMADAMKSSTGDTMGRHITITFAIAETDGPRDRRYQATFNDFDLDCPIGWGETEAEAIEDLLVMHGLPK